MNTDGVEWVVHDGRGNGTSEQVRVDSPYDGAIAVFAPTDRGVAHARLAAKAPKMLDVIRNAAAIDEVWLASAGRDALRQALHELREEARKID